MDWEPFLSAALLFVTLFLSCLSLHVWRQEEEMTRADVWVVILSCLMWSVLAVVQGWIS
ncbi:MAG: hypothetical protein V3T24_04760 [Longimicrobiales bacterium]